MSSPPHQYVIGVGSQRCGTTLLFHLLSSMQGIFMHPLKELHYFDSLQRPPGNSFRALQKRGAERRLASMRPWRGHFRGRYWRHTNELLANKEQHEYAYSDLFRYIPGRSANRFLGEITPAYMLLTDSSLMKMRREVGNARIILIERDPLQRVISAFKLHITRSVGRESRSFSDAELDRRFLELLETKGTWVDLQRAFNQYADAAARYRKHFDHVLVMDHTIFKDQAACVSRLEEFLGTRANRDQVSRHLKVKYNSHKRGYRPSNEVIEVLQDRFMLSGVDML
jgi:hypothetical protein